MATLTLTDEELLQACLDASYLESLLTRNAQPPTVRSGAGTVAGRFRECTAQFLQWLGGAEGARASTDPSELWRLMFQHGAKEHIEHLTVTGQFDEAAQFSAASQAVCARLASLREAIPASVSWQDVVTTELLPLEHATAKNGTPGVTVKATLTSLRRREDGNVEMVEHRLGAAEASEADIIRFAIDAWLLKQGPRPLRAHGIIEGYTPERDEVLMSSVQAEPHQLEEVFDVSVRPVLLRLASHAVGAYSPALPA